LRAEGFDDVQYVTRPAGDQQRGMADGEDRSLATAVVAIRPSVIARAVNESLRVMSRPYGSGLATPARQ